MKLPLEDWQEETQHDVDVQFFHDIHDMELQMTAELERVLPTLHKQCTQSICTEDNSATLLDVLHVSECWCAVHYTANCIAVCM